MRISYLSLLGLLSPRQFFSRTGSFVNYWQPLSNNITLETFKMYYQVSKFRILHVLKADFLCLQQARSTRIEAFCRLSRWLGFFNVFYTVDFAKLQRVCVNITEDFTRPYHSVKTILHINDIPRGTDVIFKFA